MSKLNAFQLFIRQALLYPLTSPFLPSPDDVRTGVSYANSQKTGTLVPGNLLVIPKSYQTTSYRTGDDGDTEYGVNTSPRFTDNGDGTITDNFTTLIWVKEPQLIIPGASVRSDNQIQTAKSNYATSTAYAVGDVVKDNGATNNFYVCVSAHTSNGANVAADLANFADSWRQSVWTASAANKTTPATHIWNDAIDQCLALDYAGQTDWRLPNINELWSITKLGQSSPCIDTSKFPNTQGGNYASSSTPQPSNGNRYFIAFQYPYISFGLPSNPYYVRPCRAGV